MGLYSYSNIKRTIFHIAQLYRIRDFYIKNCNLIRFRRTHIWLINYMHFFIGLKDIYFKGNNQIYNILVFFITLFELLCFLSINIKKFKKFNFFFIIIYLLSSFLSVIILLFTIKSNFHQSKKSYSCNYYY